MKTFINLPDLTKASSSNPVGWKDFKSQYCYYERVFVSRYYHMNRFWKSAAYSIKKSTETVYLRGFWKPVCAFLRLLETCLCDQLVALGNPSMTALAAISDHQKLVVFSWINIFKYLKNYKLKRCKNHKRPYSKLWFSFPEFKVKSKIWWDCTLILVEIQSKEYLALAWTKKVGCFAEE